jgi:ActR/RegA family two-component response regulator
MILRCLVFSHDERAVRLLRLSLEDLAIDVEHCTELARANELLLREKFDGVVSDCELRDGPELLRSVRRSKHNRRSIIFAVTGTQITMGSAFAMGAHFVIYKPLVTERVKRTLSAAHGLMMREKRLHFRHPAKTPASLRIGQRPPINVSILDISQHGALVDIGTVLKRNQPVQMKFTLPETSFVVETDARVTWSDRLGRSGVRFENLPEASQTRLTEWAIERSSDAPPAKASVPQPVAATAETRTPVPMDSHHPDFDFEVQEPVEQREEGEDPAEADSRLRATLRGQHHAEVKILAFLNRQPIILQGKCQNLSELGLAATVDDELGIGDAVLLQLALPGSQHPLVVHATVRHREDERYGFEFVAIDSAVRDLLRKSVDNLPVE